MKVLNSLETEPYSDSPMVLALLKFSIVDDRRALTLELVDAPRSARRSAPLRFCTPSRTPSSASVRRNGR